MAEEEPPSPLSAGGATLPWGLGTLRRVLSGRAVPVPSGVESSRDWPRGRLSKVHVSEESR